MAKSTPDLTEASLTAMMADHAVLVGSVAMAWSGLCEAYGQAFVRLISADRHKTGFAAWHAVKSDRYQRQMLEAVAKELLIESHEFRKGITWAVNQTNSLEEKRNDTVHTPYAYEIDFDSRQFRVVPLVDTHNPKALKLAQTVLTTTLIDYRRIISDLTLYVLGLLHAWDGHTKTWPDKPSLRETAQTTTPKGTPQGNSRKAQKPPPRS